MEKSLHEKAAEIIVVLILSVIMLRIPYSHFFCYINGLYYSYIAHSIYFFSAICLAVVLFSLYVFRKRIKLSSYEAVFRAMAVFQIISCCSAQNTHYAVYGAPGRNEGIIMLFCYYLFFYAARLITDEKMRGLVMKFFIAVMTVHALYGLGQFYDLTELSFIHDYYHYAISGVAGNPNFMGSLMVMACGACTGMMIYSEKIIFKAFSAVLLAVFTTTLIFTKTMSAYVGLAMIAFTVFVLRIGYIYRKKGKRVAAAVTAASAVSAVILLFIADKLAYGIISKEISIVLNQLKDGFDIETAASGRFLIWSNIFKMLPQYLLFGVGIDGLERPYFERYGLFFGAYLDKAHNELIHILITMGLPVLVLYILLYVFILKDLSARIKSKKNKAVNMALLFVIIGYFTQAMFNISVIDVAPYFWIMLGLAAKPLIF